MNHLYLSGKYIECCLVLARKPYHIKRIDNLSSMLYQTKRSESYPRILLFRKEIRVSSPYVTPSRICDGSPPYPITPNEVRGLLFSFLQLHPKTTLCLWGKFERGQFPLSIDEGSPTLEVSNVPHPCL